MLESRPRWLAAAFATLAAVTLLVDPASAAGTSSVTVFYKPPAAWSTVDIHYAPNGGGWTTVPGVAMDEAACDGWVKKTVALGTVTDGTLNASVSGKGDMRVYVLSTSATPAPGKVGTDDPFLR